MSGAIYFAISDSQELRDLGVENVLSDYEGELISRDSLTVILRWGSQNYQRVVRTGPRDLDVWVHMPAEMGTDFTMINRALNEITKIIESIGEEPGPDGVSVTEAVKVGASGNIHDPGFNSFTRNYSYRVQLAEMV